MPANIDIFDKLKLSSDDKDILRRHLTLGRHKSLSYLPIRTVEKLLGSVEAYRALSVAARLGCVVLGPNECCIQSGAVYAYSETHLGELLKEHADNLNSCGWPTEPEKFIRRIASQWLAEDDPVLPVVHQAFGTR